MDEPSLRGGLEFMRTYEAGLSAIRYPRDNVSDIFTADGEACPPFELGKSRALVEHEKPDLAILGYGVMAISAMQALEQLGEYKINVYDARFARPVDIELLRSLIERRIPVVTIEDHGIEGGFGSCVIDTANQHGLDTRGITRLAIPCRWIYQGARGDQLEESGLDPASIARTVREVLDASPERVPLITVERKAPEPIRS